MSNKRLIGTLGSFATAAGLIASTNYVPVISASKAVSLKGENRVELTVTNTIPYSTNNFIDSIERPQGDANIGGSYERKVSNISANSNGVYKVTIVPNKGQEFYRAGREE